MRRRPSVRVIWCRVWDAVYKQTFSRRDHLAGISSQRHVRVVLLSLIVIVPH